MVPDVIHVRMLGTFSLRCGDQKITDNDNRSRKIWLLLAYMIQNRGRSVSQDDLMSLLWGDVEKVTNPSNAMKTMFHRLRAMLDGLGEGMGHTLIVRAENSYRWNPEVSVVVDSERFESLCRFASSESSKAKEMEALLTALDLYEGDFLPKLAIESWTVPIAAYFHNLYLDALLRVLGQLEIEAKWSEISKLCRQGVHIEPYNEGLYLYLMRSLLKQDDQRGAIRVYEEMRDLFYDNFSVLPSEEAQALYREAVKTGNERTVSITTVLDQLKEKEALPGALYCDYDFFKILYQAEARMLSRSGFAVHVGLISVLDERGEELQKRSLNRCMENLQTLVCANLRKGDVAARCSASQYILLLPQANYENSCMVCDRIVRAFSSQYPHSLAKLRYSVQPLEPNA